MKIRLVAVDLDGTLLKNDKSLSPATVEAVEHAAACGLEVAIATGRTLCEFSHLLRQLPAIRYAVACTGASLLDCRTGQELAFSPLSAADLRIAWQRLQSFQVLFEVFQDGKIYVDEAKMPNLPYYMSASRNPGLAGTRTGMPGFAAWLETQTKPAAKVHMFFPDSAEREAAWDAIRDLDAFICCSDDADLEIMARGVNKGTGLARLAQYLHLDSSQVMAVGDSGNDLGMLQYAGVRAVMANGAEDLKELADIITDTNERDGVARLLQDLTAGHLEQVYRRRPTLH